MLWVFGDSFAQSHDNTPDQWMQKTATELNTKVKSYGLNGSSLEYMYYQFDLARNKIQKDDVLVLILTGLDRRWFFKYSPGHNHPESPNGNKKETKAIEYYKNFLDTNNETSNIHLKNFLYNIHALTHKLNLHTIVISNFLDTANLLKSEKNKFPLFHLANGLLLDVSMYEYTYDFFYKENDGKTYGDNDRRINHLLRSNHLVLANKILDNILYKKQIDLNTDFKKHIMSEEIVNDTDFIDYELFGDKAYDFMGIRR